MNQEKRSITRTESHVQTVQSQSQGKGRRESPLSAKAKAELKEHTRAIALAVFGGLYRGDERGPARWEMREAA